MAQTIFQGVAIPVANLEQSSENHERRLTSLEIGFWEVVKQKQAKGELTWLQPPQLPNTY